MSAVLAFVFLCIIAAAVYVVGSSARTSAVRLVCFAGAAILALMAVANLLRLA